MAMYASGKGGWNHRLYSRRRLRLLSIIVGALLFVLVLWGILVALLPASVWLLVEPDPGTHPSVPWIFRLAHPLTVVYFLQYLLRVTWENVREDSILRERLLALTFVLAGLLAAIVLWKGPQWQVARVAGLNRRERFDRQNEARKTLATILGGVAFLTSAYFGWRNFSLAQEGQITDRYTRAIAQLGDPKLEVRLGGIYSLEAIANESRSFHWSVMEVLTAFVRENAPAVPEKLPASAANGDSRRESPSQEHPSADIQAIIDVIGRRKREYERFFQNADLSRTNLRGADLHESHFEGVNFDGANLSSAVLEGAYLQHAFLRCANLGTADFEDSHIDGAFFGGADLQSSKNLNQSQIDSARGSRLTKLPSDLHPPSEWNEVVVDAEDRCSPPK